MNFLFSRGIEGVWKANRGRIFSHHRGVRFWRNFRGSGEGMSLEQMSCGFPLWMFLGSHLRIVCVCVCFGFR